MNAQDEHGYTALMNASAMIPGEEVNHIVELLLRVPNVRVDTKDNEGYTSLHWAAFSNNVKVGRMLVSAGASCNDVSSKGETPLHRASRFGNADFIALLLEIDKATKPFALDKELQTPWDVAGQYQSGANKSKVDVKKLQLSREALAAGFPRYCTLIVHNPKTLLHNTGDHHQESPQRITSILEGLKRGNFYDFELKLHSHFERAGRDDLLRVHSSEYVRNVITMADSVAKSGDVIPFTPSLKTIEQHAPLPSDTTSSDTPFSVGSFEAALYACGSVKYAVDKVVKEEFKNAFCCVRPPGHHAGWAGGAPLAHSCGFCIFNSVAVGALYALDVHRDCVKKVAIVDIDIHHGNGTEDIVRHLNRPSDILFISIHLHDKTTREGEFSFYPYSGDKDDVAMNIYNIPMEPLWRSDHINPRRPAEPKLGRNSFKEKVLLRLVPILRAFDADLIFLSSGFDGGVKDVGNRRLGAEKYTGGMDLDPKDFAWCTKEILNVAKLTCDGKVVSVLEGGYGSYSKDGTGISCDTFAANALSHIGALMAK